MIETPSLPPSPSLSHLGPHHPLPVDAHVKVLERVAVGDAVQVLGLDDDA